MLRISELLKKTFNLLLFTVALSQIFLYEACMESLERILKMELLWRFLVSFGV